MSSVNPTYIPSHLQSPSQFEQELADTIEQYCVNPSIDPQNLYNVTRELTIARYALNRQAEAYSKSVTILTNLLEKRFADMKLDDQKAAQLLASVMQSINYIESQSTRLIESVEKVIKLVGNASNIDIDKGALKTILVNLPSLVKESIANISKDSELAESVSNSLNQKITDFFVAVRFSERDQIVGSTSSNGSNDLASIQEQVGQMIHSVPTAEYVPADNNGHIRLPVVTENK